MKFQIGDLLNKFSIFHRENHGDLHGEKLDLRFEKPKKLQKRLIA